MVEVEAELRLSAKKPYVHGGQNALFPSCAREGEIISALII
jgi:hypothetical protein